VPPRFFAPDLVPSSATVTLPSSESQHLVRVLRLQTGAAVEVFDGRGAMRAGTVRQAAPGAAIVELGAAVASQPEPPHAIVLCASLLKGDAMDEVVRDATVLGVSRIQPILTARTNVPRSSLSSGRAHARWSRVAIAAAKQCGRSVLPVLDDVRPLDDLLRDTALHEMQRLLLVEPALSPAAGEWDGPEPRDVILAVGPEGGWDPDEVERATRAGWTRWSLGPYTLRAAQVTLAALSIVRYAWQERASRRD
jgi:16S rRNA (uracil1498-N3)-methyltransferase